MPSYMPVRVTVHKMLSSSKSHPMRSWPLSSAKEAVVSGVDLVFWAGNERSLKKTFLL